MKKNQRALDLLRKFNVIIDDATEQAILDGMITVPEVLKEYGKNCCDWIVISKPSEDSEYTPEECDFFEKYITSFLEIGKERDVVIDYVDDGKDITVQVKHKDCWCELNRDLGWYDEWYAKYLELERMDEEFSK